MYCKTKDIFSIFLCLLFMYYFCEKYYKPITVQQYIADCVIQVPWLTLLEFIKLYQTYEQIGLMNMLSEQNCIQGLNIVKTETVEATSKIFTILFFKKRFAFPESSPFSWIWFDFALS